MQASCVRVITISQVLAGAKLGDRQLAARCEVE